VTADRSAAADTLRDELAAVIEKFAGHWLAKGDNIALAEAVLPVVRRFADAQVAAERVAAAADLRLCGLLAENAKNPSRAAAFETAAEIVEARGQL
jgi:hypothetical protein